MAFKKVKDDKKKEKKKIIFLVKKNQIYRTLCSGIACYHRETTYRLHCYASITQWYLFVADECLNWRKYILYSDHTHTHSRCLLVCVDIQVCIFLALRHWSLFRVTKVWLKHVVSLFFSWRCMLMTLMCWRCYLIRIIIRVITNSRLSEAAPIQIPAPHNQL